MSLPKIDGELAAVELIAKTLNQYSLVTQQSIINAAVAYCRLLDGKRIDQIYEDGMKAGGDPEK